MMKFLIVLAISASLVSTALVAPAANVDSTVPSTAPSKRPTTRQTNGGVTLTEAKADIVMQIQKIMGRPLNDAELQMVEVKRNGVQISITIHQPLSGRLRAVMAERRAQAHHPTTAAAPPTAAPTTIPTSTN